MCSENNQQVTLGEETYAISEDGYLTPTRKGSAGAGPALLHAATQVTTEATDPARRAGKNNTDRW